MIKHKVDTEHYPPIRRRPYRVPSHQRDKVQQHIETMLKQGVIQPSTSPWADPVVLVQKKDGTDCFCVEYRWLNDITKKDSYPLPRVDDTLEPSVEPSISPSLTLCLDIGKWNSSKILWKRQLLLPKVACTDSRSSHLDSAMLLVHSSVLWNVLRGLSW